MKSSSFRSRRQRRRALRLQKLERRQLLAAHPVISEFVASNTSGFSDGYGDDPDWIEIRNDAAVTLDLGGYHLTDDHTDLNKWQFPSGTVLDPGEYLVVFASSKSVVDPAGNLHTNFQLSQQGDYIALTDPDQQVLSEFGAGGIDYPPQISNISYGLLGSELVSPDSVASYLIPTSSIVDGGWYQGSFQPEVYGFTLGRAAIGYENSLGSATSYASEFLTEVPSGTTGVYQRINFEIDDVSQVTDLVLQMQSDDGFAAYLNGFPVASLNAPSLLAYDSIASADHPDASVLPGQTYPLSDKLGYLQQGTNVLAIHALNRSSGSSDFLSVPRLLTQSIVGGGGYLTEPTPGGPNTSVMEVGPLIGDVESATTTAIPGQPLVITAEVAAFETPLDSSSVTLHYRVMFGDEISLAMSDDGQGADAIAGDGVFSAEIPGSSAVAGEMVRWRVTAADSVGIQTRAPRFLDALDSAEYFGTVVDNSAVTTDLPILQWFIENPSAASTNNGTRASLFVSGELHDNISVNNHGQSTRGSAFPKKSFDFDANSGFKFKLKDELKRVSDFNLLTNYADQTKLRHSLMYDLFAQADYAHHFAFSTMVYQNGSFYGLYDIVEEGDTEYLDRLGEDPDNPLYKVNNRVDHAYNRVEKKSREYEDHSDFQEVVTAAQTLTGDAALTWDFDHLDIADMVNYLAIHNVASSSDFGHKNMYWYRDTNGTGQWSALPWDQDLSLGHLWDASVSPSYFRDDLVWNLSIYRGGGNAIFGRLYNDPVFLEMYTRRIRTLADEFYGAPGSSVSESYLAKNINRLEALIADEAVEDMNHWGIQANFTRTPAEAADQLVDEFIPLRRNYLDGLSEVPASQIESPTITFDQLDYDADPVSGSQLEEYIRLNNLNDFAVDLSGWRLDGGIDHRFRGGTVIPAGGSLYVVKDVKAFQQRSGGPSAGSRLLIQGNYQGQLSYTGETVDLYATDGRKVDSLTTPLGTPTTNQQFLRVTEVNYHPLAGDNEFIEFSNVSAGAIATTLDLSGVAVNEGPSLPFIFPPGTLLPAGQRIVIAADIDTLLVSYPGLNAATVAGQFQGSLSNSGERIKVIDAGGETIVDFSYRDSRPWPLASDGAGATLVLNDEAGVSPLRLGKPYSYRASRSSGGSPGAESSDPHSVVINELLTHTDLPQRDAIELFNPGNASVDVSGWYLSDSKQDLLKFRIPNGTVIAAGGYLIFDESDFNPTPATPGANDFALNGSQGDEVWLVIPDVAETAVSEFVDSVVVGATLNGQAFGRLPNGAGPMAPLASPTLGDANTAHAVGSVVISEFFYHPDEPGPEIQAIDPTIDSADLEFVELHNHSSLSVDLSHWRLRGDVDFDFAAGINLDAGNTLVVVSFDPDDPGAADRLHAFRSRFGIGDQVNLVGPYSASQGNSYGRIELEHPDAAPADDPTVMPRVTMDEVYYDDLSPWPTEADGQGQSLHRVSEFAYANLPESWQGQLPTPGTTYYQPHVVDVTINDGASQRSHVTKLAVTFDRDVSLDSDAFAIYRQSDSAAVEGLVVATEVVNGQTVASIRFASGSMVVSRGTGHSLVDGDYVLTINAGSVSSTIGQAPLPDQFQHGETQLDDFFRRFGDGNGDRDVDGADLRLFAETFRKPLDHEAFNDAFDSDGDGDVDVQDFGRFRRNQNGNA